MSSEVLSPEPSSRARPTYLSALSQLIHKDLAHRVSWTDLTVHWPASFPRPLLAGVPPQPLLTTDTDDPSLVALSAGRREWVLPATLTESWSVAQWAEVFDALPSEGPPPVAAGQVRAYDYEKGIEEIEVDTREMDQIFTEAEREGEADTKERKDLGKKRVVMAIVAGDSSVVYYIVHDGIVKPRQN